MAHELEPVVQLLTLGLASVLEVLAAGIIAIGAAQAIYRTLSGLWRGPSVNPAIRLQLGRWLVLSLEFLVAADILRTAVAPTWNDIGLLAATVVLRTVLNYTLQREIEKGEELQADLRPSP